MAPRKRKADGEADQPAVSRRVTRSASRPASLGKQQPEKKKPKPTKKGEAKAKEVKETETESGEEEHKVNGSGKTIVIEHCKQCTQFKIRAIKVKEGLEKAVPGIAVMLNPDKPRRGCFEIREEGGDVFISLLDMKRPFGPMKALDMEQVVSDIVEMIK